MILAHWRYVRAVVDVGTLARGDVLSGEVVRESIAWTAEDGLRVDVVVGLRALTYAAGVDVLCWRRVRVEA
ncbi:MAG: hypothetical protein A2064_02235 [Spirochaetes bacterium GWB1_66_5]|nr:MAG: hypothetical protein A2064_02235 [Spirochaetes bacterium GWB1_66_5]